MYVNDSEALGYVAWWGLSPAINIINSSPSENETVNVFCFGFNDVRHIIKTVSENRSLPLKIKFKIFELSIEAVAREILQLFLLGLPNREMGLQDKCEVFLELYGNTLIRESTETWLEDFATNMIKIITETNKFERFHPHLYFHNLKSKDRDHLECTFKSWRRKNLPKFDISTYWDSRVRQHLGVRYDATPNVFDWDCSIVLRDRGLRTFESREYARWRSTGVAFTPRQASYLSPNRSLASPRYFSHRHCSGDLGGTTLIGYWGDIVCSPFLAFGTFTDRSPELSKTLPGGRVVYGASVLSELNLRCLLWEMSHGKTAPKSIVSPEYDAEKEEANSNDESLKRDANAPVIANDETIKGGNEDNENESTTKEYGKLEPEIQDVNLCERFEVDFYSPGTTFVDLSTRLLSKFTDEEDRASVIYVGCSSLHLLEKAIGTNVLDVCKSDCRLIIESVLYIIGLKDENIRAYAERAQEIASSLGFKLEGSFDAMVDHHMFFVREKK